MPLKSSSALDVPPDLPGAVALARLPLSPAPVIGALGAIASTDAVWLSPNGLGTGRNTDLYLGATKLGDIPNTAVYPPR